MDVPVPSIPLAAHRYDQLHCAISVVEVHYCRVLMLAL